MGGPSFSQLLIILIILGSFLIPLFLTIFSKRARGAEKFGWSILVLFTSWIGYAAFLIVTQIVEANRQR